MQKPPTALALSTLVLSVVIAGTASGRDIFVNNLSGDDRNDGHEEKAVIGGSGPCRTIARALRAADKGDRIVIANTGEPYREGVTVQAGWNSGYEYRPFIIEGNGAVLDGSQPVPKDEWTHVVGNVFRFQPKRLAHQQLFRDDRPLVRREVVEPVQLPKLEPLEWCLFNQAIYFRTEPFKIPQNYNLSYAAETVGVTLYEVRNVVINNLIVQGFQLDGVNAHDSAFDVTLSGVTARGNGRSGVSVGGASRVTLEACLLGNNGVAQLRTEGFSHTRVLDSDLLDNTAPPVVREGGELTIEDRRPPAG
ncbi:MAG: right-handed parallel beta-helix repeat-containing protein [Pirellulaceae bacterium]